VKKAILAARLAGRTSCRHLSSAPLDFLPSTFEVAIKAKMDRSRNGHCRKTLKFREGVNTCKLRVFKVVTRKAIAFSAPFPMMGRTTR
jgi:hypothetical protein